MHLPYFNRQVELEHLRPHRDMSKGVSPRLYVVRLAGETAQENYKTVVVTEGEFKAAALKQVLPQVGVVAIPGISMCWDDCPGTFSLGLEKKFRKPNLDCGSSRELKVTKKLLKCLLSFAQPDSQTRRTIEELAAAYRNTLGGYYIFKPLIHEKTERAYWRSLLDQARTKAQWDQAYAAEQVLRGRPHRFTDFIMEPMYSIQLVSGAAIERIVKLRNVSGEIKRRAKLDSDSFGQPSKFRTWLLNMGNFTWSEGERELNKLQEDINRELAYRLVYQVAHFGWHDESRLWFYLDCAVTPVGHFLLPDEDAAPVRIG